MDVMVAAVAVPDGNLRVVPYERTSGWSS